MTIDEKAKRAAAYVREFLGDPKNQDLLNHFDSEVRNAKYEGRAEEKISFSKRLIDAGVDKNVVAKCANLSISELDELLVKN